MKARQRILAADRARLSDAIQATVALHTAVDMAVGPTNRVEIKFGRWPATVAEIDVVVTALFALRKNLLAGVIEPLPATELAP